jgi:replicative DNA helicase
MGWETAGNYGAQQHSSIPEYPLTYEVGRERGMNIYPSINSPTDIVSLVSGDQTNAEAEQALIGAVLMNNANLDHFPARFKTEHFSEALHQEIFEIMTDMIHQGKAVNAVTIKSYLRDSTQKVKIGDKSLSQYLAAAANDAAAPYMIKGMADAVTRCHQLSRLFSSGSMVQFIARSVPVDADIVPMVHREIEAQLDVIAALTENDDVSPGDAYLNEFEAAAKSDQIAGVPMVLPEVATVLSEPMFEAGNLYGILSSSGEGKTSFTLQQILSSVEEGHPVMFLSYDQTAGQCVRQMVAQKFGISMRQQRTPGKLTDFESDKCVEFATWMNRQAFQIINCTREGVKELVSYAKGFVKKHKRNGKTPLIVIDHIGKISPRDARQSPDKISTDITVECKAFAKAFKAVVLMLCQRNSQGSKRDNPKPIASDLYGGEGARQDYDAILYLYRPQKYKAEREKIAASDSDFKKINKVFGSDSEDIAEIGTIKCRFGDPTLTEQLKFEARYTRYRSPERSINTYETSRMDL